jgi:histidinol-phosphate aminotransferase
VTSPFRANVERMTAYVPGEQPAPGARVIKLNTNENPYPPSPRVAEAISSELAGGGARLRLYSDPAALELRSAASEATGLPIENILAGNGSDELLALLVRALVEPGETIAYPYPTYVLYETLAEAQGARVRTVPFPRDFALPQELSSLGAKLVFVASPNSPSGNSHPAAALGSLAASMPDGVLVVDEAYADFADENALELARTRPNVVVLRTFSKSQSLAGMRVGLLFASPDLVAGIAKVKDSYNLDRLAIVAGAAALRDSAWMRANVAKIRATRERLTAELTRRGHEVLPSSANFVFVRLGSAERARGAYLGLKAQGILVRYFDRPALDDGLRITVGTEDEITALLAALGA